jgi:hypothetical protein
MFSTHDAAYSAMQVPPFAQMKINSPSKLKNIKRIIIKSISGFILLALISRNEKSYDIEFISGGMPYKAIYAR